jgi:TRAP-type C4-dicarboxylate transport system permease small subunit
MIAAGIIMTLTTVDILVRRLLDTEIKGTFEICDYLLVVTVFCSVAYVMTVKGHVVVDVFTSKYPQRLYRVISVIALFLSLIMVGLICWGSIRYGLNQLAVGEASPLLNIPAAPFVFVIALGSALFFLVIIIQLIRIFAKVRED